MYKFKKTVYYWNDATHSYLRQKTSRVMYESKKWKEWHAIITPWTCYYCASMNGRILAFDAPQLIDFPAHQNCRCYIESVTVIAAGTATTAGTNGVDLYVARFGRLPSYYLTQEAAKANGWNKLLGNLDIALPGRMIGGDEFANRKHKLPESAGRIWYEADFDYEGGYRNGCRLLYSNDGLLFATYDHYMTFFEIGLEGLKRKRSPWTFPAFDPTGSCTST